MPAFKEMTGVTLATQVLSHMVAAGQILALLTKIQRHQLDLIEFLAIDLLNSWLLRTMEKTTYQEEFFALCVVIFPC